MGFPTRPSRSAFGPQYVNKRPVIRNDREIGQEIFNLLFWQVAGLSVAGAVALLRIDWNGTTLSLGASGEAWDPDASIVPTLTNPSTGEYQVVYAASYPDELGISIATNLLGVAPAVQTLSDQHVVAKVASDKRTIDVRLRNSAGTLINLTSGDAILLAVF